MRFHSYYLYSAFDGSFTNIRHYKAVSYTHRDVYKRQLQYIECLRDFEDSPEQTSIHAFSTVDTLAFNNVLYAVFIFADSFYRTRLFTRYGNIYNLSLIHIYYRQLHPAEMSGKRRLQCLADLKEIGYQTGTGIMVGSPGQTVEHIRLPKSRQFVDVSAFSPNDFAEYSILSHGQGIHLVIVIAAVL